MTISRGEHSALGNPIPVTGKQSVNLNQVARDAVGPESTSASTSSLLTSASPLVSGASEDAESQFMVTSRTPKNHRNSPVGRKIYSSNGSSIIIPCSSEQFHEHYSGHFLARDQRCSPLGETSCPRFIKSTPSWCSCLFLVAANTDFTCWNVGHL